MLKHSQMKRFPSQFGPSDLCRLLPDHAKGPRKIVNDAGMDEWWCARTSSRLALLPSPRTFEYIAEEKRQGKKTLGSPLDEVPVFPLSDVGEVEPMHP